MPTVLIADDSLFQRMMISNIAGKLDVQTVQAETGAKAMEHIESGNVDLAILDLNMPEINGVDVLRKMHASDSQIPTVIVTADIQDSTRKLCEELGAVAILHKPVDDEKLCSLIRDCLG